VSSSGAVWRVPIGGVGALPEGSRRDTGGGGRGLRDADQLPCFRSLSCFEFVCSDSSATALLSPPGSRIPSQG